MVLRKARNFDLGLAIESKTTSSEKFSFFFLADASTDVFKR